MTIATTIKGGASAPLTITVTETGDSSTFRTLRYADPGVASSIDGEAFRVSWQRYVGSVHRHWQTGQLVLCWSTEGPHPIERENLRARLESHPGNIGAVLAAVDAKNAEWDAVCERSYERAGGAA